MANYAYVAKAHDGREVSGYLVGSSRDDVVNRLHQQELIVLQIIEARMRGAEQAPRRGLADLMASPVGSRDLALFSTQFSTVLEAGIPLVRGLKGLAADTANRTLSRAVDDIGDRVAQGSTLADAMAAHPRAFNEMYVNMVRAGERAGTLDEIIAKLAAYLEKVDTIRGKVRSALAYPLFVTGFVVLASLFLLLEVVPTFSEVYTEMGQELPTMTRLVIAASDALRLHAGLVLPAIGMVVVLLVAFLRTRAGRLFKDRLALHVPILGSLIRMSVMSRFTRTFGLLVRSGLPIMESLTMVSGAVGNAVVARSVLRARDLVERGQPLTEAFRQTGGFPEMVLQLMATGEDAGNLDAMLLKTSEFYDRQIEASAQSLASLIEPVMVVVVGGLIGFIVVSMFLPIFHMGDAIMQGAAGM